MGNLFGKPKEKKSDFSEKDRAVLELKRQRIRLLEYKKQAAGVLDRETAVAKQLLKKGDKKRNGTGVWSDSAALALKKKKYQQQLLDKTDAQLFNVEELVNSIEFAAVQQKVFEALKTGNTVLQKINDTMKIEDVEKLMEDSAEAVAHQNKVNELLGGELTEADNEAIEKELAAFEYEDAVKEQQQKDEKKKVESSPPKRRPSLTPIAVPPILLDGRLDLQSPAIPAGPGLEPATPVRTQAAIAMAEAEARADHTAGVAVVEPPVVAAPAAAPAPAAGSTPAPKRSLVLA